MLSLISSIFLSLQKIVFTDQSLPSSMVKTKILKGKKLYEIISNRPKCMGANATYNFEKDFRQ